MAVFGTERSSIAGLSEHLSCTAGTLLLSEDTSCSRERKKKKKRRVLQLFVRFGCGSGLPSALRPFAATSRAAAPRRGLPAPRCPAGTQAAAAAKQCHKSYCKCYMIQIVLYHSMSHITTPMQWVSEVKRKPVLTIFIFCNFIQTVLV